MVVEFARFRVKEGEDEEMLAKRPGMLRALQEEFPAMRSIQLVRMDDGTWMDVVVWESREEAERAAREAPQIPDIAAAFAHLDETVSFEHGELRESFYATTTAAA